MTKQNQRSYKCKDEELTAICGFVAYCLERDRENFVAYSPKFSPAYITGFKAKTDSLNAIVNPEEETLVLKKITEHLHGYMDALAGPINRVSGYLSLAKPSLNITPNEFGLTQLRKSIATRNAEATLNGLRTVNANLLRYNTELSAQGLTPELTSKFTAASAPIEAENKKQYEILSKRKGIVQNNINLFNSHYAQLSEILRIGKILYKTTDPVKAQEYNFTALRKKVHSSAKANGGTDDETPLTGEGLSESTI